MVIKGVVFDVGQTLSNQFDKDKLFDRCKHYYGYVFDQLILRNFQERFGWLADYPREEFVEDLHTLNVYFRNQKNMSTEVWTEYRMSEQALQVLVNKHNLVTGSNQTSDQFRDLLPQLDEIFSGTDAIQPGIYELWPDTLETLRELKRLGYQIALASNSTHPVKHEHMLEQLGITPFIDVPVVSSYVGVRKPNPKMLEIILERMNMTKDEVVIVGDLLDRDVLMGNLLGVTSIWINAIPYSLDQNLMRIKEGNPQYMPKEGIVCLAQLIPTIQYLNEQTPDPDQIKVGYYFPHLRKKLETGKQGAFVTNPKVSYMPIELRAPIEHLGNFDVIVHKVTDLMLSGLPEDQEGLDNLRAYLRNNPKVLLLDPLEGLEITNSRREFLTRFNEITIENTKIRGPRVYNQDDITYPCIVKTNTACQVKGSHLMGLTKTEKGLSKVIKSITGDIIITEWVKHLGGVFKIYVLGDEFQITPRDSFSLDNSDYVIFDSAKPIPDNLRLLPPVESLNERIISVLNQRLREFTGLGLLSYDLLIEETTGDYIIVDLNYFPGYYTFPDYKNAMNRYIISRFRSQS